MVVSLNSWLESNEEERNPKPFNRSVLEEALSDLQEFAKEAREGKERLEAQVIQKSMSLKYE